MTPSIPLPLHQEHEALHEQLRLATSADGEVGEAARTLARRMHPHFVQEDAIALPPLGLLQALARGEVDPGMADVLVMTDRLEAAMPQMLAEHETIREALQQLQDAAARAGRADRVAFTQQLAQHARMEEEVMYPAALLVGRYLRLAQGRDGASQGR